MTVKSSFTRQEPPLTDSTYADRCWSAPKNGSRKSTLLFKTSTKSLFPLQILHDPNTSTDCDIVSSFTMEGKFPKSREFSISLVNTLIFYVRSLAMVNVIPDDTP